MFFLPFDAPVVIEETTDLHKWDGFALQICTADIPLQRKFVKFPSTGAGVINGPGWTKLRAQI